MGNTYFSLTPSEPFFVAIETLASSNPQDEDACATPAATSKSAEANDCVNRIVLGDVPVAKSTCRGEAGNPLKLNEHLFSWGAHARPPSITWKVTDNSTPEGTVRPTVK
jgi:hypothetical protein